MSEKYPLFETLSPIDREERTKITENWKRIMSYFDHLQAQVKILSGNTELDEILMGIESAINNANTAVVQMNKNVQESLDEMAVALSELETAILNANTVADETAGAKDEALKATSDVRNATAELRTALNSFVSKNEWSSTTQYYKNNLVTVGGNTYIALQDNINKIVTDKTVWALFAARGEKGEKGDTGTGIVVKGRFDSVSELPTSGQTGDAYMINGNLFVWEGAGWEDAGNIKGEKGDAGLSAYAVAATKGFVGSESEWLASLKGEKGEQGLPGKDADTTQIEQQLATHMSETSKKHIHSSGSNNNGYYIKFDDGTLICTGMFITSTPYDIATVVLPHAFAYGDYIISLLTVNNTSGSHIEALANNTAVHPLTNFSIYLRNNNGSAATSWTRVHFITIGRWK